MNYIEMAQDIAKQEGIDPDIFVRLIQQESSFDPDAVSEKGAAGLPQIMPKTALKPGYGVEAISLEDRFDPEISLRFGAQYLRAMLDKYDGDYARALAAYNKGPGGTPEEGKVPYVKETYDYVGSILDPASAVNLFDVGDYPVGVELREDVQSILGLAEGDETVPELLERVKEEEQKEMAYDSLVRQYQAMAESQSQAPEFIEDIRPRKSINVLRSLGIGGLFDG
ncbi:MAG: lytic transglycosylase domain-containing protein [Alphaproteobacteria bacterium]